MDTKKHTARLIKIIKEVNGYSRKELDKQRYTLVNHFDHKQYMKTMDTVEEFIKSIYSHVLLSTNFYDNIYEYFYTYNNDFCKSTFFPLLSRRLTNPIFYYHDNKEGLELMLEFNELLKDVYGIDLTDIQCIPRQKIDINYLCEKYNITDSYNEEDLSTTSW